MVPAGSWLSPSSVEADATWTVLVPPSGGTPSKKMVSTFRLVPGLHPVKKRRAPITAAPIQKCCFPFTGVSSTSREDRSESGLSLTKAVDADLPGAVLVGDDYQIFHLKTRGGIATEQVYVLVVYDDLGRQIQARVARVRLAKPH